MWVDRIARVLGKSPEYIRQLNFLNEGDVTHFGQIMESNHVRIPPPAFCTRTNTLLARLPAQSPLGLGSHSIDGCFECQVLVAY